MKENFKRAKIGDNSTVFHKNKPQSFLSWNSQAQLKLCLQHG